MLVLLIAVGVVGTVGAIAAALVLHQRQQNRVYISAKFTRSRPRPVAPMGAAQPTKAPPASPTPSGKATPPSDRPTPRIPAHPPEAAPIPRGTTPQPLKEPALTSIDMRARTRAQAGRVGKAGAAITTPRPLPKPPQIPDVFTPPPPAQHPQRPQQGRAPSQEYPKLVRLLQGDRAAARRLVQGLMASYPDKSERWCYEKALFDLERDRH